MSENVQQYLERTAPRLEARVENNIDLANVFMGFLGRVCLLAAARGIPVEGVSFGTPSITEKRVTAKIAFSSLNLPTHSIFGRGTSFDEYAASKSKHMAGAMARNPNFGTLFEQILRLLDAYCRDKGRDFATLKLYKSFIDGDDTLVLWVK